MTLSPFVPLVLPTKPFYSAPVEPTFTKFKLDCVRECKLELEVYFSSYYQKVLSHDVKKKNKAKVGKNYTQPQSWISKTTLVLDLVTLLPFGMFCSNCPPRVAVRQGQREEQERELVLLQEEREEDSLYHPPSGQVPELLLDCVVSGWPQHVVCSNCTLWPAWVAHLCTMWVPGVIYWLRHVFWKKK